MISFSFTDRASRTGCAIVGDSAEHARGLIVGGGSDAAAATATASVRDGGLKARLEAGALVLELNASALYPPLDLGEPALTAAACRVRAELSADGERKPVDGAGQLSRSGDPVWSGGGRRRHLSAVLDDGSLLIAVAAGAHGAAHGEENVAAWLIDADGGASRFGEPLLSTQYDGEGHVTRVGLELWSDQPDSPPVRAAGVPLAGPSRPIAEAGPQVSLLEWSIDGRPATGAYVLWRA